MWRRYTNRLPLPFYNANASRDKCTEPLFSLDSGRTWIFFYDVIKATVTRPPQYASAPLRRTLRPSTPYACGAQRALLPVAVGAMNIHDVRDRQTSDTHHRLMTPSYRGEGIMMTNADDSARPHRHSSPERPPAG